MSYRRVPARHWRKDTTRNRACGLIWLKTGKPVRSRHDSMILAGSSLRQQIKAIRFEVMFLLYMNKTTRDNHISEETYKYELYATHIKQITFWWNHWSVIFRNNIYLFWEFTFFFLSIRLHMFLFVFFPSDSSIDKNKYVRPILPFLFTATASILSIDDCIVI